MSSDIAVRLCDLFAEATDALSLRDGLAALVSPSPLIAERGGHPLWEPVGGTPDLPADAASLALGRWGRLISTPEVISLLSPYAAGLAKAFDRCDRTVGTPGVRLDGERKRSAAGQINPGPDGILLTDLDGACRLANRAFFEIFGRRAATSDPPTLHGLASFFTKPNLFLSWTERAVSAPGSTDTLELTLKEASGQRLEITSGLLSNGRGDAFGRLFVFRDSRESGVDQAKAEFINVVSHELRTPLTSVLGFAELVLTRNLNAEKQRQYVSTIYEEGKRLSALLDDFLDINRLESRRQPYDMQEVDLRPLLDKSASLFGTSEQHTLTVSCPGNLPRAIGDTERLTQCLNNLVSNAIKYSPDGGQVRLSASRGQNGQVIVSVSDEGLGIPESAMGQLFRKFYRVHRPEWQGIGGTGLGLAICREIVRAHGGEIWCESREGIGSTFSFTLPTASRQPSGRHPSAASRSQRGR